MGDEGHASREEEARAEFSHGGGGGEEDRGRDLPPRRGTSFSRSAPGAARSRFPSPGAAPRSSPTKSTARSSISSARSSRPQATSRFATPTSAPWTSTRRPGRARPDELQARGQHSLQPHRHDPHRSRPLADAERGRAHGPAGGRRSDTGGAGREKLRYIVDFSPELTL